MTLIDDVAAPGERQTILYIYRLLRVRPREAQNMLMCDMFVLLYFSLQLCYARISKRSI